MKNIKFLLVLLSILSSSILIAQKEISDSTEFLFNSNGSFTKIKNTPEEVNAKMVKPNPLIDDVVWSKVVLRVIDLRDETNKPLYYPSENMNETTQKNLFSIIFSNLLTKKLTGYFDISQMNDQTFVPEFTERNIVDVDNLDVLSRGSMPMRETIWDKVNWLSPGIIKYYIQEIWYFNKATSTFHNKIIAIAPIYDQNYNAQEPEIRSGVWFWFPFDKVRPLLQEEFIKMSGHNTASILNFDDFFITRQFSGYIIKDYDLNGKTVDYGTDDPKLIKQQQDRIEAEILNFEQDLWNY